MTLGLLAEHGNSLARLSEAVVAMRAALEEFTRERVPLKWARIQNDLSIAFQWLGVRRDDPHRLREALAAVRLAHDFYVNEAGDTRLQGYFANYTAMIEAELDALTRNQRDKGS